MYVSLSSILTAPFKRTRGVDQKEQNAAAAAAGDHAYVRGDHSIRSPCPGLNALANQGYIARDGKNITVPSLEAALHTALHMSPLAAKSLTSALKPLLREDGTFDLVDTRKHNVIEHDSSFTRLDYHQGDNHTFQLPMFEAMLADGGGDSITHRSVAKTFIRRDKESRAAGAPKLPLNLWFVRTLQAVGVINSAALGGTLSREVLESIFVEERIPDVVLENTKPRTVLTLLGHAVHMLWWVVIGP